MLLQINTDLNHIYNSITQYIAKSSEQISFKLRFSVRPLIYELVFCKSSGRMWRENRSIMRAAMYFQCSRPLFLYLAFQRIQQLSTCSLMNCAVRKMKMLSFCAMLLPTKLLYPYKSFLNHPFSLPQVKSSNDADLLNPCDLV